MYQTEYSMAIFPGEPRLAGFIGAKIMEVVVTTGAMCKAPVKSLPSVNQHPTFYRPDALPVTQPTASKH